MELKIRLNEAHDSDLIDRIKPLVDGGMRHTEALRIVFASLTAELAAYKNVVAAFSPIINYHGVQPPAMPQASAAPVEMMEDEGGDPFAVDLSGITFGGETSR